MLSSFANLPRPVQAVVCLASGGALISVVWALIDPSNPFFKWIAIGVVVLILVLALFKLTLMLRDRAKSGPFASLLTKSTRTAADPALKARMDDLRRKFEEGVVTFKQAGKDLYSLPWYLLVGPAGSGKTEALRHCNVGFPPGLQDPLQGSGGTLNMHWWFTNHAVVIDTAGRMFMEGADEGGGAEWREFLKLLKTARPHVPVNGLLLVISSESLLKDSAEKIEQTAGAIARQLDVVQRTLDVRFPVTVVVTKCDKIVGFREFFEHINDPNLQHQILGWSNPAPLDEAFKPDQVDKHLDSVRHKLMRRRMGQMQNPVHTVDANARRTDQVDELFELPDNLMRIAPRLRRYLEMIFVAGEWSPKPLFLRGIYFTSSMREGQALDMSLAQALGVDVESIPGGRDWDREKSYFLRDLFMTKVFKEKGLVTRATNVSKALRKQRAMLVGAAMVTAIVLGGITVLGYFQFNASLGPPSAMWRNVRGAFAGDPANDVAPLPAKELSLIGLKDNAWVYRGRESFSDPDVLGSAVANPAELIEETGSYKEIKPPLIARPAAPLLGFGNSFLDAQEGAHRAIVESTTIVPLLEATRSMLAEEKEWRPEAVAALAQLVRVESWSFGGQPALDAGPTLAELGDAARDARVPASRKAPPAVDVDALFRYVLGKDAYEDPKGYKGDREKIVAAVKAAYPRGFSADQRPSASLGGRDETNRRLNESAAAALAERMKSGGSPGGDMGALIDLQRHLTAFAEAEKVLRASQWLRSGAGAAAGAPRTLTTYASFEQEVGGQLAKLAQAKAGIDEAVGVLGPKADNPMELLAKAGEQWEKDAAGYFDRLIEQLPRGPESLDGRVGEAAGKLLDGTPEELKAPRSRLMTHREAVVAAVRTQLEKMRSDVQATAMLVAPGRTASTEARAYAARWACYELAAEEVRTAATAPEAASTLARQMDDIDARVRRVGEGVAAWTGWTATAAALKPLSEEQKASLRQDADEAAAVSRRIAEVASSRRLHEAVKRTIAAWPATLDAAKETVTRLAGARIEGGGPRPDRPRLKLTEMESGGEFAREFYPDAAREFLGDWAKVRELVDPGSTGNRQVMDADALKGERYVAAGRLSEQYAVEYLRYWRRQAIEATMVSAKNWQEFAAGMKDLFPDDVNMLKSLQETVGAALAAVPPGVTSGSTLEDARNEMGRAFSGLSGEAFGARGGIVEGLRAWRRLATLEGGAPAAVEQLRAMYRGGDIQAEYFAQYGKGVAYWDGVVVRGLELLTEATQGDIARAQNTLLAADAAPICFGPPTMRDLTPEELRAVAEAARNVAASIPVSGAATRPITGLEPRIADLLGRLFGSNFIKADPQRLVWFNRLQGVLDKVAGKDPVRLELNLLADIPAGTAGGKQMAPEAGYKFAALFVNGRKVGDAFNIFSASSIPADKAKDLAVTLPVQSSEIGLYREDPKNTDPPPDERIALPGPWSLLGTMVRGRESDRVGPGTWRVMVANDRVYVWLTIKVDPDMPPKGEWPAFDAWPGR